MSWTNSGRDGRSRILSVAGLLGVLLTRSALGESFNSYQYAGTFELPAGATVFDALKDGRIITLVGSSVYTETSADSRTFVLLGSLPAANFPSFGAAFVRVSPDGTEVAIGNNGGASFSDYRVGVFDRDTLSGAWFAANHFDAEWIDNRYVAITAGDFVNPSVVTALDTQSGDPDAPNNPTIVQNIGGASGGVAFDSAGRLYTGNGFTAGGPSGTGAVKAFPFASWSGAISGGMIPNFEASGTLVVDVLSASPLALDREGNLLVGGGDFSTSGEYDFVALVRNSAIAAALSGGSPADSNNPGQARRWDPDSVNEFNYYTVQYNAVLHRAYVFDASTTTVHIYQDTTGIPTVSEWGMVNAAMGMLILGTCVIRNSSRLGVENALA